MCKLLNNLQITPSEITLKKFLSQKSRIENNLQDFFGPA